MNSDIYRKKNPKKPTQQKNQTKPKQPTYNFPRPPKVYKKPKIRQ